jgi:hypothetical protein
VVNTNELVAENAALRTRVAEAEARNAELERLVSLPWHRAGEHAEIAERRAERAEAALREITAYKVRNHGGWVPDAEGNVEHVRAIARNYFATTEEDMPPTSVRGPAPEDGCWGDQPYCFEENVKNPGHCICETAPAATTEEDGWRRAVPDIASNLGPDTATTEEDGGG